MNVYGFRNRIALMVFSAAVMFCPVHGAQKAAQEGRQKEYLRQLLSVLPAERPDRGAVSPLDRTWRDWLERTGELPPDFEALPSLPFLPDPLVLDEGGKNIPVETAAQWLEKRRWMRKEIQHWITGTFPPPPDNLTAEILNERHTHGMTVRTVELRFGPERKARLTLELYIPPGDGPFPVFMTPGADGSSWITVSQAVRRGYIGCLYAACDAKDDTEGYASLWYPEYDFTRLMRRAWGASRAVDYLYTLHCIDRNKIGLTGLSRDGKQVLMAAAFDERFNAVIPCSGGTGSEDPWRYTGDKFDNETIVQITTNFPYWLHPRLRFFVGREHKLPVDQNLLMALVAPRPLLIRSAITEDQGNPWGIEQIFHSVRNVYRFLGAEKKLGIYLAHGVHSPSARDTELFVDFFDHAFGRGKIPPPVKIHYDYSFSSWQGVSGETVDPLDYPEKGIDDILGDEHGGTISGVGGWESKRAQVRERIRWGIGEDPPGSDPSFRPDVLRSVIGLPPMPDSVMVRTLNAGVLFYSKGMQARGSVPAVIYLHEYSYPTGFVRNSSDIIRGFIDNGFAVLAFDQIGFGTRIEEGTLFYERFPHWSKLGRMVADTKSAIDGLEKIDFIDGRRIYTAGYALGGLVGLYTASVDDRVAGVVSVCGFTPMRLDTREKGTEGIRRYSHLHGLLPRLGFFDGRESRIPYDFHEIIACIAPRPVLIVSPTWDRDNSFANVKQCVEESAKVYTLYNASGNLDLYAPEDYNRFSQDMQRHVFEWMRKNF